MSQTALNILKNHTKYKGLNSRQELYILDAMRDIYELGFKDGGHMAAFNGYPGQTDAPSLEERIKQLFPEK